MPLKLSLFPNIIPMKRNFLLLTVMVFALSCTLSAAEPTVIRPFNGTNLDGWKLRNSQEGSWQVGQLNATATTFELIPLVLVESQQVSTGRQPAAGPLLRFTLYQWRPPVNLQRYEPALPGHMALLSMGSFAYF